MSLLNSAKDAIGLTTVVGAPRDYKLLVANRMLRFFAFGGIAIINAKYLKLIGFQEDMIGIFFTVTMLGDLFISFLLSLIADRAGRRRMLMISACILCMTGIVFFITENHAILMAAAIFGFMTPSGNEVGPFRSIEQSIVAHLVPLEDRSACYAFYTFLGQVSTAAGSMTSGIVMQILQKFMSEKDSYKVAYLTLIFNSCIMILITGFLMSEQTELELLDNEADEDANIELLSNKDDAEDRLTPEPTASIPQKQSATSRALIFVKGFFPKVEEKEIVVKLGALFIIDTTAKSLVTKTWVSYYLRQKFHLIASELGSVFFVHDILVAGAILIGGAIGRKKGIIFTMLATHFPSIIFNSLIPAFPYVMPTIFMIWGRGCFQAMDISSKHAFVASIVKPESRTAVIAWMNLCRTVGQALSPTITGYVTGLDKQWISFVLSGILRLTYDIGLFINFWHIRDRL